VRPFGRSFVKQPLGIALLMDGAAIRINFAIFQFDRLEADTAKERSLAGHSATSHSTF
jgi:hypothetical protein